MKGRSDWAQPLRSRGLVPRALGRAENTVLGDLGGQVEISCAARATGAEASDVDNLSTPSPCATELKDMEWSGKQRCWRPSVA